jgi:hypothetical protein
MTVSLFFMADGSKRPSEKSVRPGVPILARTRNKPTLLRLFNDISKAVFRDFGFFVVS